MRQRNDTLSALYVPADPPFEVLPGESVDYPDYLIGLTPVEDSALATGGVVDPGTTKRFLVGEAGPEIPVPPQKKRSSGRAPSGEEPTE